ncbi:MAG: TetR/AcrR family transcriptional regulator [Methanomicrobiaceae archaeon]|nr:TetR/AcrR family transcriptional regulator [Methanomicrobiaceae archaeon]
MDGPHTDKRQAILETALGLFCERGFHGTPTSMITREAEVATGTLFHYFSTKEALIETIYLTIKGEMREALCAHIEPQDPVGEQIRRICANYIRWGVENARKFQFMEQFHNAPQISAHAHEEGMAQFSFVHDIVQRGIDEGALKPHPTGLQFSMFGASTGAVVRLILSGNGGEGIDALIDQAIDLIWDGIAAPAASPTPPR